MPEILHVGKYYPPHRGGVETYLCDLATRQAQCAKVSVIVANDHAGGDVTERDGVLIRRIRTFGMVASMPVCPTLPWVLKRSPADIVHVHMPNPGAALGVLLSGHPGKIVITHHADTLGRQLLRRVSGRFVSRLMDRASRIIVTSEGYLHSSPELKPFRSKCCVIPLGISMKEAGPGAMERASEIQAEAGKKIVLAVGRLVPYKGYDILIRAMRRIHAVLVLIGTGPEAARLARISVEEGVEGKVRMIGVVEDLSPYFLAASVFVLPSISRAEAFGLAQLEAMSAGLPVVNTSLATGVPEVSVSGETGITVLPGDSDALANAIQLLFGRADLRDLYGQNAKAKVREGFTADLMADRTMALYREVLNGLHG